MERKEPQITQMSNNVDSPNDHNVDTTPFLLDTTSPNDLNDCHKRNNPLGTWAGSELAPSALLKPSTNHDYPKESNTACCEGGDWGTTLMLAIRLNQKSPLMLLLAPLNIAFGNKSNHPHHC